MYRSKYLYPIVLGFAAAIGIAWFIRKQSKGTPTLGAWEQVFVRRHGAEKAKQLSTAVRQQRSALLAEASMPENRMLCMHLKENILPGLALYRVLLREYDGNQSAALEEVDEAFRQETMPKLRWLFLPMKVLPAPFRLLKFMLPKVMKQYPAEGWDITYVEDSDEKIAFNITRCFYLDTLTSYGALELTATFCKGDDRMAELFPSSIRFVRLHTLGRGDALCDFQYCRMEER